MPDAALNFWSVLENIDGKGLVLTTYGQEAPARQHYARTMVTADYRPARLFRPVGRGEQHLIEEHGF